MKTQHTPTPWEINERKKNLVFSKSKCVLETTEWDAEANARHIVKCVNMHEELIKTIENCYSILNVYVNGGNPNSPYKDGQHSLYVLGAKEMLDKCKELLQKESES